MTSEKALLLRIEQMPVDEFNKLVGLVRRYDVKTLKRLKNDHFELGNTTNVEHMAFAIEYRKFLDRTAKEKAF